MPGAGDLAAGRAGQLEETKEEPKRPPGTALSERTEWTVSPVERQVHKLGRAPGRRRGSQKGAGGVSQETSTRRHGRSHPAGTPEHCILMSQGQ